MMLLAWNDWQRHAIVKCVSFVPLQLIQSLLGHVIWSGTRHYNTLPLCTLGFAHPVTRHPPPLCEDS